MTDVESGQKKLPYLTEPTEITEKNRGLRLFGQDLQDRQDIFAFPEERQKASSLFEGIHITFAVGELHSVSFIPARNALATPGIARLSRGGRACEAGRWKLTEKDRR